MSRFIFKAAFSRRSRVDSSSGQCFIMGVALIR
jgi:hypothetical protein